MLGGMIAIFPGACRIMDNGSILVVDDDRAFRLATETLLSDEGFRVTLMSNGNLGLEAVRNGEYDLILSDVVMPELGGVDFLREVRMLRPNIPVIMVTGFGSIQTAVEAMRLGATDYLTKPCNNQELVIKIRRALEGGLKDRELKQLREELRGIYTFGSIVSRSQKMGEILRQIERVADTDVTVLVEGESGTGKELVARALHFNSRRRDRPFVAVNCSALPENLLESELFGYEKGSFTGAARQRVGKFEEANCGTIFLDEIGDVPLSVQTKLLRVLQEKTITRIGSNTTITIDTRIIAATNRNLEVMMRQGDFREDLYYRLNVFPITLPPLRERLEDIPILAEHFVHRYADLGGGKAKSLSPSVLHDMMHYSWRGNIRELQNLLKRAIIKTQGDVITQIELPTQGESRSTVEPLLPETTDPPPYKEYLSAIVRDAEERYIRKMLRAHKGNIIQIARVMEIDRKTLYRKMAEYSIDPSSYRMVK
jgi:DNA-binding NtrC family response regulator